jgi:acetyl esterase/lipase
MERERARVPVEPIDRRAFLLATAAGLVWPPLSGAQSPVTRPVVSEEACPLDSFAPEAADGHRGLAVLRKPPGPGPFPVVVWFHGGIATVAVQRLEEMTRDLANLPRLLAAGYVVVAPTYRSRDVDLQNPATVADALAVVEYVRRLEVVDRRSVIVAGCSGGGDLALETAARTEVCAVVAEEPASVLMTGVFNNDTPKKGERYTPEDSFFMLENGRRYFTPSMRRAFLAKLKKIDCPILIVQGDEDRREAPINEFNADVLIPELRAAGKEVEVSVYPKQAHCFCSASGAPRPGGAAAPASWPAAALKASQDIQAFCRRHVRTRPNAIDAQLITQEVVRQGPIA